MAIKVQRSMLQQKYSWESLSGDGPRDQKKDAVMFNRREGYEVVPMIQKVVDHFDFQAESDVNKVEDAITNELPGNVRSRENVFNWLVEFLS